MSALRERVGAAMQAVWDKETDQGYVSFELIDALSVAVITAVLDGIAEPSDKVLTPLGFNLPARHRWARAIAVLREEQEL
jgi:hypothetical protein